MAKQVMGLWLEGKQRDSLTELALSIGCINPKAKQPTATGSISEMARMIATAMQKHPSDTAATMRLIKQIAQDD